MSCFQNLIPRSMGTEFYLAVFFFLFMGKGHTFFSDESLPSLDTHASQVNILHYRDNFIFKERYMFFFLFNYYFTLYQRKTNTSCSLDFLLLINTFFLDRGKLKIYQHSFSILCIASVISILHSLPVFNSKIICSGPIHWVFISEVTNDFTAD